MSTLRTEVLGTSGYQAASLNSMNQVEEESEATKQKAVEIQQTEQAQKTGNMQSAQIPLDALPKRGIDYTVSETEVKNVVRQLTNDPVLAEGIVDLSHQAMPQMMSMSAMNLALTAATLDSVNNSVVARSKDIQLASNVRTQEIQARIVERREEIQKLVEEQQKSQKMGFFQKLFKAVVDIFSALSNFPNVFAMAAGLGVAVTSTVCNFANIKMPPQLEKAMQIIGYASLASLGAAGLLKGVPSLLAKVGFKAPKELLSKASAKLGSKLGGLGDKVYSKLVGNADEYLHRAWEKLKLSPKLKYDRKIVRGSQITAGLGGAGMITSGLLHTSVEAKYARDKGEHEMKELSFSNQQSDLRYFLRHENEKMADLIKQQGNTLQSATKQEKELKEAELKIIQGMVSH